MSPSSRFAVRHYSNLPGLWQTSHKAFACLSWSCAAPTSMFFLAVENYFPPRSMAECHLTKRKRHLGHSSPFVFAWSGELCHRSRREIVLVPKRKHGGRGSTRPRKARRGCRRGLSMISSGMMLRARWTSSTSWTLAHMVPLPTKCATSL